MTDEAKRSGADVARQAMMLGDSIYTLLGAYDPKVSSTALMDAMAKVLAGDPEFKTADTEALAKTLRQLVFGYRQRLEEHRRAASPIIQAPPGMRVPRVP